MYILFGFDPRKRTRRDVALDNFERRTLTRRDFAAAACGLAAACLAGGQAALAAQGEEGFDATLARIIGKARPITGAIKFDIPEHAENGLMVAYTIAVESPMTEKDHVEAVHLLSSGNVKPVVSSFKFSAASGKAAISGRIRLAKTQKVVAVAALSGGRFLVSEKMVNVKVGSCG